MGLLFPEHEQKHELSESFFCLFIAFFYSNLFIAFKIIVIENWQNIVM